MLSAIAIDSVMVIISVATWVSAKATDSVTLATKLATAVWVSVIAAVSVTEAGKLAVADSVVDVAAVSVTVVV